MGNPGGLEKFKMKNKILIIALVFLLVLPMVNTAIWGVGLDVGLIAYYNFNEGSGDLIDSVAGVFDGTVNDITSREVEIQGSPTGINKGYEFDGSDDDITVTGALPSSVLGTVSVWFNSSHDAGDAFQEALMGSDLEEFALIHYDGGSFRIYINKNKVLDVDPSGWGSAGDWIHLIVTWDTTNENTTIFIDSVDVGTSATATGTPAPIDLRIGDQRDLGRNWEGTISEIGFWDRMLSKAEIDDLYNSGDGITKGKIIDVTLDFPADNVKTPSPVTFNCSGETNSGLSNISLWTNGTGTWHRNQTIDITGFDNTTTFEVNFSLGKFKWNCEGCNDQTSCAFFATNYTLEIYAFSENSQTFNNITYETSRETFEIDLTYDDSIFTAIRGDLIYNDASYTGIRNGTGSNAIFYKTIDIPSVNKITNHTFYWNITLTNASGSDNYYDSITYNQTVNPIILNICNATYTQSFLNFTISDENNGTLLNATFDIGFNYWVGSGLTVKNYSYQNLTGHNNYSFCVSPTDLVLHTDMDLEYDFPSYYPRTRHLRNATLTNASSVLNLYLIAEDDSIKFFITVLDGLDKFADAIITVNKYFVGEGVYKTIGVRETNDDGKFVEYLELDKKYRFIIVKDGVNYGSIDKTAICETAPCLMELQLAQAKSDLWEGYYDIYGENVEYLLYYNDTSKNVTFEFIDLTGLANYFRLSVNEISFNETGDNICNKLLYTTSGSLVCDMTGYEGNFRASGYVNRSPDKLLEAIMFIMQTISGILGLEGVLIGLFVIITISFVGAWNPVAGVMLTTFAVFVMATLGFVAIGYTSVLAIFILAIIVIMKMRT